MRLVVICDDAAGNERRQIVERPVVVGVQLTAEDAAALVELDDCSADDVMEDRLDARRALDDLWLRDRPGGHDLMRLDRRIRGRHALELHLCVREDAPPSLSVRNEAGDRSRRRLQRVSSRRGTRSLRR